VKAKKTVLIVTDGSAVMAKLAEEIAAALKGNKVSTKAASDFKGNDILPADVFFLGCEKPKPASFAYLADVLKHINLAGRPCGVFSSGSEKAAKYLAGLVKDCEAALNPEPLLTGGGLHVKNWAQSVISRAF
jgi:hypothetical protein